MNKLSEMAFAFSNRVADKAEDLEHLVAQIPEHELVGATGIVLRVGVDLWHLFAAETVDINKVSDSLRSEIDKVLNRAPNIDIFLLLDGHSAAMEAMKSVLLPSPHQLINESTKSIIFQAVANSVSEAIRAAEFATVFEKGRTRSVISSSTNYHFSLPSGAHASQFIRLGDAFSEMAMVDRIAYWIALEMQLQILPEGQGVLRATSDEHDQNKHDTDPDTLIADTAQPHALIVDHPSMLILASRVHALISVPIEIVSFPAYPTDSEALAASFARLGELKSRCASAFVVIGVASTGRLANHIRTWGENFGVGFNLRVRVLYAACELPTIPAEQVMCQLELPGYQHYATGSDCKFCATSKAVPVQSSSYLVGQSPTEPAVLGKGYFDEQHGFLNRWGEYKGVLRVHYDDPNEPSGHHAFYVDVGTLLDIPEFFAEMIGEIKLLVPPPDVVIAPALPVPKRLGVLIAEGLKCPLVELDMSTLASVDEVVNDSLFRAETVLVVDDVFSTGNRFKGIVRYLREQGVKRAPNLKYTHLWTVIASLASRNNYAKTKRGLTSVQDAWKAGLSHFFTLALPDWAKEDCPWCIEFRELTALTQDNVFQDGPIAIRIAELWDTRSGINDEPFFGCEIMPTPNLGAGSYAQAADASPIRALFACASGIQQLRYGQKPLSADQFPAPSYFALRNFSENYTEHLLWLAMLRSLTARELEGELKQFLVDIALDQDIQNSSYIRNELAVAWLTGKLGAIRISTSCQNFFGEFGVRWEMLRYRGLVDGNPIPSDVEIGKLENTIKAPKAVRSSRPPPAWLKGDFKVRP